MNWGVNFQIVNVHCLKLRPLTHNSLPSLTQIMIICVMFNEMELICEKNTWNFFFFPTHEPSSYKYLHVLVMWHGQ
jgi:hypothetical protein